MLTDSVACYENTRGHSCRFCIYTAMANGSFGYAQDDSVGKEVT